MIAELEIDLDALRANVRALARLAAPAAVCAVVKGNAYGHGLVPVARALERDTARLAVYRLEEALVLREAGIRGRIHILGPIEARRLGEAITADVEMTLWDGGAWSEALRAAARNAGRRATVHLKVETGVTRFGFTPEAAPRAIASALSDPDLAVRGVFTHLAAAEELASDYTREQLARFTSATGEATPALAACGAVRHAAASSAAMLFPSLRLDMIRTGIAAYGLWPSPQTQSAVDGRLTLVPALRWSSTLVVVRDVPAFTAVGYGCTYRTERPSRIGIVPLGYAEGIPRSASGRAEMIVGGRRVPVRGRVCMNVTFVDVTDVPTARAGSPVTLIGRDGAETIGADDWAAWCDTISYEIVTRLPSELPRRYREVPLPSSTVVADT